MFKAIFGSTSPPKASSVGIFSFIGFKIGFAKAQTTNTAMSTAISTFPDMSDQELSLSSDFVCVMNGLLLHFVNLCDERRRMFSNNLIGC